MHRALSHLRYNTFVKAQELENRARNIINAVLTGRPVEDDRIEIKAIWIGEVNAARRLAAHANIARGEPILWLVGLDEKRRVVTGAEPVEMANWLPAVAKHFDGAAPTLLGHLNIHIEDQTITALYFRTDLGAPFVIKNPKGGYPEFEIPWRKGTRLRSAARADLLSLLVPITRTPHVRLLSVQLSLVVTQNNPVVSGNERGDRFDWKIDASFYITPKSSKAIVFPNLNCIAQFAVSDYSSGVYQLPVVFKPLGQSSTVTCATTETLFFGPGSVCLEAAGSVMEDFRRMSFQLPQGFADIEMIFMPANGVRLIYLVRRLRPVVDDSLIGKIFTGNRRNWVI